MTSQKSKTWKILLPFYIGSSLMIFGSIQYALQWVAGIMFDNEISSELWYGIVLRIHIVTGILAIFIGPTQMIGSLRDRNIHLHRKLGYLYTVSVIISGLIGTILSFYAMGTIVSKSGLFTLSVFWLFSIYMSVASILKKDIEKHQLWMYINYGLTFGAVTQRIMLLLFLATPISFDTYYGIVNWLSWICNTIIAIYLYNKQRRSEIVL